MTEFTPEKLLEVAMLAVITVLLCLPLKWQTLVKGVLILVVIEGAIRKWFLPGLSQFVYFGKDFIALIAYFKFFTSTSSTERAPYKDPLLSISILLASIFVTLQAANISLGSPVVGLFGARNYVWYIPLVFLVPKMFETQDELARFLKFYLLLAVPVVALSIIQYYSPPNSPLNIYVAEEETSKAMIGKRVRVTGTFSYVAGFASYLQTIAAFVVPMLIINLGKKWDLLMRVVLMCIVVGILFTGSRGPVLTLALFGVGYFVFNRAFRALGLYKRFILLGFVAILGISVVFAGAIDRFAGRFSGTSDMGMRILASITTPFAYTKYSGLIGYGAGATYQAAGRIRDMLELPDGEHIPVFYESEPERVMLELGPLGFLLWYIVRFRIMLLFWGAYKALHLPLLKEFALTGFLINLLSLPGQMVFQITFNVYYWFLAGFIFLLPRLEENEFADREDEESERQGEFLKEKEGETDFEAESEWA